LKTRPLKLSIYFIQVIKLLISIFMVAFTVTLIYSLMNTDAFSGLTIEDGFSPGLDIGNFRICSACDSDQYLAVSALSPAMKFWLLVRGIILFSLVLKSLQIVLRIVRSIQSRSSFYEKNITGFLILSKLGLVIAFFSSFNFFIQGDVSDVQFAIPLGPIGYVLACKLLAEIFREGKMLSEDSNSII